MIIKLDEPIVVPSVAVKTYPEQWVYNLILHAPPGSAGRVTIELLPYNATTGEVGPSQLMESFGTERLLQAIQDVPEMQVALNAVIAAVKPMQEWIQEQNANNTVE